MKKINTITIACGALLMIILLNIPTTCNAGPLESGVVKVKTDLFEPKYKSLYLDTIQPMINNALTQIKTLQAQINLLDPNKQNLETAKNNLMQCTKNFDSINTMLTSLNAALTDAQKNRITRIKKYKTQLENISKNILNLYQTIAVDGILSYRPAPKRKDTPQGPRMIWYQQGVPLTEETISAITKTKKAYDNLGKTLFDPIIEKAQELDKKVGSLADTVGTGIGTVKSDVSGGIASGQQNVQEKKDTITGAYEKTITTIKETPKAITDSYKKTSGSVSGAVKKIKKLW